MKIAIVDDHTLFCEGMRTILSKLNAEVTLLEASRCEEGLVLAEQHPDLSLVLQDINMPDMDGCIAVRKFCDQFPSLPVVILTASTNTHDMRRSFDAGAMGYICKTSSGKVMLSALRLVLAGGIYVPPELAGIRGSATAPAAGKAKSQDLDLTERQHQVLLQLLDGRSNKDIARRLGLSDATVKAYVTVILKALGVHSRTEAVLRAREIMPDKF